MRVFEEVVYFFNDIFIDKICSCRVDKNGRICRHLLKPSFTIGLLRNETSLRRRTRYLLLSCTTRTEDLKLLRIIKNNPTIIPTTMPTNRSVSSIAIDGNHERDKLIEAFSIKILK